ncbi:chromate efflux transporter [uncultured Alsobacter sp.]|uniref:chromate efflux transporter n=1 Tax=uncultured Alsobacter sp. TaxID=1748258 RepID=UPI0025CF532F|nr:chromate efflux transporter [uncultured Alsobacter sp.]
MGHPTTAVDPNAMLPPKRPTLRDALPVWARIAALSFGGPAGQIAVMHRVLVDEKRWISESRFLHALNYCMLLPGPEAQQLATYVGWLLHGPRGGLLAGGLFILPGLLAIMGLSWIYASLGAVGLVAALFFGLKAAVLAIVLQAVQRVGARALRNRVMLAIAAAAFVAIFAFGVPFPLIVLGAAAVGYLGARQGLPAFSPGGGHGSSSRPSGTAVRYVLDDAGEGRPSPAMASSARRAAAISALLWLAPVAAVVLALGAGSTFGQIAVFFSKMAMVTFGGAYAALAYVAQEAVGTLGWLRPGEMLDGLGMAETTPGPLIMVLQFVGFLAAFRDPGALPPLVAGTLGGLLATWVTFAPCFLWIFAGAPFIEVLRGNRALAGALSAITAAVVGVIVNLAVWFAVHVLFRKVAVLTAGPLRFEVPVPSSVDPWALALAAGAAIATFRFRLGMVTTLAGCTACGIALHLAGAIP